MKAGHKVRIKNGEFQGQTGIVESYGGGTGREPPAKEKGTAKMWYVRLAEEEETRLFCEDELEIIFK